MSTPDNDKDVFDLQSLLWDVQLDALPNHQRYLHLAAQQMPNLEATNLLPLTRQFGSKWLFTFKQTGDMQIKAGANDLKS